jgi:coproporphyrinogen III oxidase
MKSTKHAEIFNGRSRFFACGLSLVLHPKAQWYQRFMPTGAILKCMIKRYNSAMVWWRTRSDPLLFERRCNTFHQTYKIACDKHNPILSKYKKTM